MDSDDRLKQKDEERKRMLEEIRRRSEAAELNRLEEEEKKTVPKASSQAPPDNLPGPASPSSPAPPPAEEAPFEPPTPREISPFPVPEPVTPSSLAPPPAEEAPFEPPIPREFSPFPVPESIPSSLSTEEQQRALILKEKFLIAIDRKKAEKAADLLSELNLIVSHEEILELREKLRRLEEAVPRGKGKRRQAEPPASSEAPAPERPRPVENRKKIAELLESVNNSYQQEKYAAALEGIAEILRIDEGNEEAVRLKEEILRAQQLAEQISREDDKRRREEAAARSALRRSEQVSGKIPSERRSGAVTSDKDFWGSSAAPSGLDIEIVPEEKGPAPPPKPPIFDRVAARIVRIRIPVKPVLIGLAVIAAVVIAYLIIDNIRNAVAPPLYSVVVFPPVISGGDSVLQGLAEGLAVDLAQDLAAVSDLRIVGLSTAYALEASTMGNLQRCRAVASNFYLRWSLGRQGESVTLQADLYDTASSTPLWSSRKISAMRELARVKTVMANALVAAMDIKVSDEELQMLNELPTSNEYAYDAYLRARTLMRHPGQYPIDTVMRVLGEAIATDSSFGRAQSALGWAHVLAYEGGDRTPVHLAQARAHVQQALSRVIRNAEAYRAWGVLELAQGQHEKAVERFEQAVAIAPSDVESQCRLAGAYVARNELGAALKAANRAVMDDPWAMRTHTMLAQVQHFSAIAHGGSPEEYRAALRTYEQGMKFAPDRSEYASLHLADLLVITQQSERALDLMVDRLARARQSYLDFYVLGRVGQSAGKPKAEWQGAFVRSEELLKSITASHPENAVALSRLALVRTRLGEFRAAVTANQQALKLSPADPAILYNTARMYAMQNDKQQAKDFLSKAVDRSFSLSDILDRDLSAIHSEPDFVKIVTR